MDGKIAEALFVPFLDATTGTETYGAGRYLDLETDDDGTWTLDFNLAYHPSCVYDPRFSCPLTPPENRLGLRVEAGERLASDRRHARLRTPQRHRSVWCSDPDADHSAPLTHPSDRPPSEPAVVSALSDEIKGVIERLLDLREAEAPLGDTGYLGPFSQKVMAQNRRGPCEDRHRDGDRTRSASLRRLNRSRAAGARSEVAR